MTSWPSVRGLSGAAALLMSDGAAGRSGNFEAAAIHFDWIRLPASSLKASASASALMTLVPIPVLCTTSRMLENGISCRSLTMSPATVSLMPLTMRNPAQHGFAYCSFLDRIVKISAIPVTRIDVNRQYLYAIFCASCINCDGE